MASPSAGRHNGRSRSRTRAASAITIFKSKPPIGGAFTATTALPEDTRSRLGETLTESVALHADRARHRVGHLGDQRRRLQSVHEVHFTGNRRSDARGPAHADRSAPERRTPSSIGFAAVLSDAPLRALAGGTVPVRLLCPSQPGACTGTITLRTRGLVRLSPHQRKPVVVTLASGSFKIAAGHTGTVKLRLTLHGRELLDRDRTMRVAVLVVSRDGAGARHVTHGLTTLRAPARPAPPLGPGRRRVCATPEVRTGRSLRAGSRRIALTRRDSPVRRSHRPPTDASRCSSSARRVPTRP